MYWADVLGSVERERILGGGEISDCGWGSTHSPAQMAFKNLFHTYTHTHKPFHRRRDQCTIDPLLAVIKPNTHTHTHTQVGVLCEPHQSGL